MSSEHILTSDHLVLARWHSFSAGGIERLLGTVRAVAAGGQSPIYVSLVGNDVAAPDAVTRKLLLEATDEARRTCSSICLVLDGDGMAFAAIRSIAAGMFLARGDRRMKMYRSLRDVLVERAADRVDAVIAAARAAAIV